MLYRLVVVFVMKPSLFIILIALCLNVAVQHVSSLTIAPADSTREEFLQAYSLCTQSDPKFVNELVLDHYIATVKLVQQQGYKMPLVGAMALSGKPNNLGWSKSIYDSMFGFQQCFGGKWLMNDTVPINEFQQEFDRFVEQGLSFFFAGALEYVPDSVVEAALRYPNVVFITPFFSDQFIGIPNIRAANPRYADASYQLGFMAQGTARGDVIGYVATVPFFVENQAFNSYVLGAIEAARVLGHDKVKRFHVIWSGDYVNEDMNRGAVDKLIEYVPEVAESMIATSSSNYEVQRYLQSRNIISTTGSADLGPYIGNELLGCSKSLWTVVLLDAFYYYAVDGGAQGWGPNTPFVFESNAYVNSLTYGSISPILSPEVLEGVQNVRKAMQASPDASLSMWCGDKMAELLDNPADLDPVTKCLNFTQLIGMNKLFPEAEDYGMYVIPITEDTLPTYAVAVMATMIGLGMLFTLFCLAMSIYHRDTAVIRLQSDKLTWAVLVFSLVSQLGLIFFLPVPSDGWCIAAVFVYIFGLGGMLSAYLTKTYGIHKLINNKIGNDPVLLRHIIWTFAIPFVAICVLLVLYASVDNDGAETLTWENSDEVEKYHTRSICEYTEASIGFIGALAGICAILSVLVAGWCFRLGRSVIRMGVLKAEAQYGMLACGCTISIGVLGGFLVFIVTDYDTRTWVIVICGLLISLGNIMIFYIPKMWVLIRGSEKNGATSVTEYTRKYSVTNNSNSNAHYSHSDIDNKTPRSATSVGMSHPYDSATSV